MKIPKKEHMTSGHQACAGCAATIAMRLVLKALGENTVFVIPACCWTIIQGAWPFSCMPKTPVFHTAFETTAATASGIKAGFEMQNLDYTVVGWAGDGGTFDIGFQALSGAAERNDDIIYICYDNEAYMNTGIQRSSSTPFGAWTTTTPGTMSKVNWKKNMPEIVAAHRVPYVATASLAYPEDLVKKVQRAKEIRGFRYIQICAPCNTGWRFDPKDTIRIGRLAVQTGIYPVYEIVNGNKYHISQPLYKGEPAPVEKLKPIEEYLKLQGRFKGLSDEDIALIQKRVNDEWEELLKKEEPIFPRKLDVNGSEERWF